MWTLLWQNYFVNFIEDIIFTFSHKLLHTPFLYKHIHKIHHKYTQPVGICAEYAHPLEFIFGNTLPFLIPMLILGTSHHQFTSVAVGCIRAVGTTYGHSGYNFPWDPFEMALFRTDTQYHDYHHKGNIDSNFGGGLYLTDFIFGYNRQYLKQQQLVEK